MTRFLYNNQASERELGAECIMPFVPEDTQTRRPATVSRTATPFVFPVTIKASRLIEAFRCGCSLIVLHLCCGKAAILTEKGERCSNPITDLDRPWSFKQFEAPRFKDNRYTMVVNFSIPHTGRLYSRKYSLYSFLLEAQSTSGPYSGTKDYSMKIFQWHNLKSNPRAHLKNSLSHPLHFQPGRKPLELKSLVSVCSTQLSVELYKLYVCCFVSCFTGLAEMFRGQTCSADRTMREALLCSYTSSFIVQCWRSADKYVWDIQKKYSK